jgi:uncharacterized protein YaiL (DUF2058 family)
VWCFILSFSRRAVGSGKLSMAIVDKIERARIKQKDKTQAATTIAQVKVMIEDGQTRIRDGAGAFYVPGCSHCFM